MDCPCGYVGIVIATCILIWFLKSYFFRKKVFPSDGIILHQFPRGAWAPSISPFPLKLETYCRMADIPYTNDFTTPMSKNKKKSPWMTCEGVEVADSQICVEYLNRMYRKDFNSHLNQEQRAISRAFQKMVEENTYWTMCYMTFIGDVSSLYSVMPYKELKLRVVARILQWFVKRQLWAQGMGRHSREEVKKMATSDVAAISQYLGDKLFFHGDEPSEVDCSIFGFLCQMRYHMSGQHHETLVKDDFPNLSRYCERMQERFWPDWNNCITEGYTKAATK